MVLVYVLVDRIIWRKKTLLDFKNIRETAGMFEFSDAKITEQTEQTDSRVAGDANEKSADWTLDLSSKMVLVLWKVHVF